MGSTFAENFRTVSNYFNALVEPDIRPVDADDPKNHLWNFTRRECLSYSLPHSYSRVEKCESHIYIKKEMLVDMSPIRMSKIESAMRIVLEFNEAFNRHDVAGMMQLMSDDCIFENTAPAPDGTVYSGKEVATQFWQDFFRESPQAHIEIEEIFGLGERCIMRWKYNWVDRGGEKGHVRGVDVFRVTNGSIHEKLSYVKG